MESYTSIFGGHEQLDIPGESIFGGQVEGHSIFGTNVTAGDAEIAAEVAPAAGPVDSAGIPITAVGPDGAIPIDDKVTYGLSVFRGQVRDVAGLGEYTRDITNIPAISGLGLSIDPTVFKFQPLQPVAQDNSKKWIYGGIAVAALAVVGGLVWYARS